MSKKWIKVEPDQNPVWNFKEDDGKFSLSEGDQLTGVFKGVKTNVGPNSANLYTITDEDGKDISVWGSTVLDSRLKNLKEGEEVMIMYKGSKVGKSNRPYHDYEVYHALPEDGGVGDEGMVAEGTEEIS